MPNHCEQVVAILGPRHVVTNLYEWVSVHGTEAKRFCDVVSPMPLSEAGNWFDWRIINWGTKWDVQDVKVKHDLQIETNGEQASFTFQCWTAWTPPVPVWDRLVQDFECVVAADYRDEYGSFEGEYNCSDKCWFPKENA